MMLKIILIVGAVVISYNIIGLILISFSVAGFTGAYREMDTDEITEQ